MAVKKTSSLAKLFDQIGHTSPLPNRRGFSSKVRLFDKSGSFRGDELGKPLWEASFPLKVKVQCLTSPFNASTGMVLIYGPNGLVTLKVPGNLTARSCNAWLEASGNPVKKHWNHEETLPNGQLALFSKFHLEQDKLQALADSKEFRNLIVEYNIAIREVGGGLKRRHSWFPNPKTLFAVGVLGFLLSAAVDGYAVIKGVVIGLMRVFGS